MNKRLMLLGVAIMMATTLFSQVENPVSWAFSIEKTGELEAEVVYSATIEYPWHVYSAFLPEGGPIATTPYYEDGSFELLGDIVEVTAAKKKFDEGFQMEVGTIGGKAEFRQKIRFSEAGTHEVKGEIEYQVCDDKTCLPPQSDAFNLNISFKASATEVEAEPVKEDVLSEIEEEPVLEEEQIDEASTEATASTEASLLDDERSLWGFFWLAFGLGLLALLTPCVFPMIPMTVSFFMQGDGSRAKGIMKGLIFGLSIVAIYTALGLIVSLSNVGPNAANVLSTHWIPNSIFFVLFVIFAFSFFGMFELVLPTSWVNRADSKVEGGGYGGAFFMALTTVLVSFSCTGPIIGALLVEAAGGLALKPILGMFGFGLAFAIPFTLFALFPSWLKGLPKSGGWLNAVKVVLGFIVLAFSMKFLLALDPANKILTRELYLAVWIVLFFLLGMYFLGKIKFSHDSDLPYLSVPRLFLAIASFSFVIFLFMGLFGYELKRIAPLLPPKSPDMIDLTQRAAAVPSGSAYHMGNASEECTPVKHADLFHMPLGLKGFYDLEEGLACAEKSGKKVLIDFKGHFCSNCKKMEAAVWTDPEVLRTLQEEFVIVALYTDDRTKLPEDEWFTSELDGRVKKTIGQQNVDYEIEHFNTNTIPLYVKMDASGKVLGAPKGTDLDIQSYLAWLKE